MPTTIRLDPKTEATVRRLAGQLSMTRSHVIREAVAAFSAAQEKAPALYERIRHIAGNAPPGPSGLSAGTGRKLAALLRKREEKRPG